MSVVATLLFDTAEKALSEVDFYDDVGDADELVTNFVRANVRRRQPSGALRQHVQEQGAPPHDGVRRAVCLTRGKKIGLFSC